MSDTVGSDGGEPPLDPALERVQQKLRRLLLYSAGIMALGLLAVFSVIAYRLVKPEGRRAQPSLDVPLVAAADMPAGGRILRSELVEGRVLVTVQGDKAAAILVVDLATLQVVRRLDLVPKQ